MTTRTSHMVEELSSISLILGTFFYLLIYFLWEHNTMFVTIMEDNRESILH